MAEKVEQVKKILIEKVTNGRAFKLYDEVAKEIDALYAVPPIPQEPKNPKPVYPKAIKYTKLSDREIENVGQILWCPEHKEAFTNNCSECMLAYNDPDTIYKAKQEIIAAYRPLLEQARQRVKELEVHISGLEVIQHADGQVIGHQAQCIVDLEAEVKRLKEELVTVTKQRDSNLEVMLEVKHRFDALESQLKSKKPVKGWEETVIPCKKNETFIWTCRDILKDRKAQAELTWRKAKQGMVELDENQDLPNSFDLYSSQSIYKKAQQEMFEAGFRRVKALASTEKGGTK